MKIKVAKVFEGPKQGSFPGRDGQVTFYEFLCGIYLPNGDKSRSKVTCFSAAMRDAIKDGIDLEVEEKEYKGEKEYKARDKDNPNLVPARSGGGGGWGGKGGGGGKGNWTPPDYTAQEAAKIPSFALSYAHDIVVAHIQSNGKLTLTEAATETKKIADSLLVWLQENAPTSNKAAAPTKPRDDDGFDATFPRNNDEFSKGPKDKDDLPF